MQFRILGPLEVRRQGRRVELGPAKQRALLAILLVHANELVSSDRLIEELWPDPPETAPNTLQVYVGKLRKALEPGRVRGAPGELLITQAPGYLLRVEAGQLDVERFETLLADGGRAREAGEHPAAAEALRAALGVWRGHALADFVYEPFAQGEIARLEELRTVALEERLDADLVLGRHAAIVGELEALVREHPLRERLRAQLMLALYRDGRQAEALEVYRDARRTLTEELGIDPGPELQGLEGAILRQDAELELPAEAAAEPVPPVEVATRAPETRKTVTILVAGAPPRASVDPEELRRLDERYLDAAKHAIEHHGGSIESVLGNRVMAVFGIPFVHEDDALRATRAAAELPGGQAGIATGEVVTSASKSAGATLAGEPVAHAGKLADAAPNGEIMLAEETFRLLGDAVRADRAENGDQPVWRLVELVPRPPPLSRPPQIPIVGRKTELGQLTGTLDRTARERGVHLLTILGAAGIGKTRLAEEFASQIAGDATVLAGRCVPYGEGITFWPLREIVGRLTAEVPLSKLLAGAADAGAVADRVTEAIGQAEASSSLEEIFWAFRRLLETVAAERPLVLLFEDVHWAEPTLLELVEYLAERGREAPILLLCMARPELLEESPGWADGRDNASTIFLERLSDAESEQLINALAARLPDETRARVHETAEGNPLFLEQILAMLAEGAAPEDEVPIPPTIQAVLAARLDRLGPGERAVIERASVVGKEFWRDAVVDQLPRDARPFASRHLEALIDKELLSRARSHLAGRDAFRFRHVLIQQAAYRAIPKRQRAAFHERAAAWTEESIGRGSTEYAESAGYHLEQAFHFRAELGPVGEGELELARRAADHLGSAGERAFQRGDMPATVNLLGRAASLPTSNGEAGLAVLPELGYALFEIGEVDEASAVLTDARARARAAGDRRVEWRITITRVRVEMYRDPTASDLDALAADTATAIDVLGEFGDEAGLARAWMVLSDLYWSEGRLRETSDAATRAAEHARRTGNRREVGWALGQNALCAIHGPMPVAEGLSWLDRLLRAEPENRTLDANLSGFVTVLEAMSGRIHEAREHIEQTRTLARDLGLKWQAAVQELLSGYIELMAGDPVAAEGDMRRAEQAFREIGEGWFLSTVAVDLPRAVYEQGRYDDAFALLGAIDDAPAPTDREWQIKRTGIPARLLARRGQLADAEKLAREGVAVAADSEFIVLHADVLLDLAEVLDLAGRVEDARASAAEAASLYERKGNVASAARARDLELEFERRLS
ncbi:MAG: BTAD domain-containing putative transcriptional regulator [Solirubrobacterales bacterium]